MLIVHDIKLTVLPKIGFHKYQKETFTIPSYLYTQIYTHAIDLSLKNFSHLTSYFPKFSFYIIQLSKSYVEYFRVTFIYSTTILQ